jgi:hypothetical protein
VVKNNAKPTPICVQGITIALMGIDTDQDGINDRGMADVWAKDLDWKSTSPCGFTPLRFSFSPDSIVMNKRFTCDEVGKNLVKMYVIDSKGSQSYCLVNIDVQNNGANIKDCVRKDTTTVNHKYSVSGMVMNQKLKGLPAISMSLQDNEVVTETITKYDTSYVETKDSMINASGALLIFTNIEKIIDSTTQTIIKQAEPITVLTDALGNYNFNAVMGKNKSYTLKCITNPRAGLSGIDENDLNVLTQVLLGKIQFSAPYMYAAADINSDGKIGYEDLNLMLDYLSGKITSFENNYVWYMDQEAYLYQPDKVLKDIYKPCVLKEISSDVTNQHFVMVQKGDISKTSKVVEDASLESRSLEESVTISPNPFTDLITIRYNAVQVGPVAITLQDISGKILFNQNADVIKGENIITIDTDHVGTGIVFYQLIQGNKRLHGKLIRVK